MFPFTFVIAPVSYSIQYIPQYTYVPPYFPQNDALNWQQISLNSNSYQEASKNSQNICIPYKQSQPEQRTLISDQQILAKGNQQNSGLSQSLKPKQIVIKKGDVKQKFGRNIMSNIFLMMVRFVHKCKKMRYYIEKIIQTYNMSIKVNEFYNMIKRKISKLPPYATENIIKSFWNSPSLENSNKNNKESQFSTIFRIVGRIYLNTYHMPYVYNTKKIKEESKKLHQIYVRIFLEL